MATTDKWPNKAAMGDSSKAQRDERVRLVPGILGLSGPGRIFGQWPQVVEIVLLAMLSTFAAHLLRLGWQAKFGIEVIE